MGEPSYPALPTVIETAEQALAWCEELVHGVEAARVACDIIPAAVSNQRAVQQRAWRTYLMQHGCALGAIGALMRVKLISPIAYNELTARVRSTLLPTCT